ncbi:MAG: SagB/ThcOx family dehydrogenase [Deltaproteobacteria bacterium]|nr:SagB/ThcOx family dehydrogenase [Deltaproteobacteria bacterium]
MNAATYHKLTSYHRKNMSPHNLDWGHMPRLYKSYPPLFSTALQPAGELPDVSLMKAFGEKWADRASPAVLNFEGLSTILTLANGFTAKRSYGTQTHFYRSAPSAGALYPNEIYVATGPVDGLAPGIYNYQVKSVALVRLRKGWHLRQITETLTDGPERTPAVSLLISGIFFRSAWKYGQRAYRYVLLNAGHLIENLVLALNAYGYSYSVHYDFDDESMGGLLGIDEQREVCLACLNIFDDRASEPRQSVKPPVELAGLERGVIEASRISAAEVSYSAITQAYTAGKTVRNDTAESADPYPVVDNMPQNWFPVRKTAEPIVSLGYVKSVLKRRSRRNFLQYPLKAANTMRLLEMLCMASDRCVDEGQTYAGCMVPGFMAVNVEGFDSGFYLLVTKKKAYGLVSGGSLGQKTAHVCLDQQWLKNGAVHFLFMANLAEVDLHQGPRGYRYAMLNAGRAGQRVYLAATALGYGACGIGALYDDEASKMLSLNDQSALLYLVAVGTTK